jgi:hypothetical protein
LGDKFDTTEDIRFCAKGAGQIVVWMNLVSATTKADVYVSLKLYADASKTVLLKSLPTVITGKTEAGWYPYVLKLTEADPDQVSGGYLQIIAGSSSNQTYVVGVHLSTINNVQVPVV